MESSFLHAPMYIIRDVQRAISSRGEQLTREEEDLLMKCQDRSKIITLACFLVGSYATWLVCRRLNPSTISWRAYLANPPSRITQNDINIFVASFGGMACGSIPAKYYVDSSLHRMLSMNGSPIQRELLKPEHDNPWSRNIVSKHLTPEVVYPESSADGKPFLRWQFEKEDFISGASETNIKDSIIKSTPTNQVMAADAVAASKSPFAPVPGVAESAEDELAPVPGVAESAEDEPKPNAPQETSRKQTRKERRSRRRHRHHGDKSDATH